MNAKRATEPPAAAASCLGTKAISMCSTYMLRANSCYMEILPRTGRYTLMVAYSPDERDDGKPLGCINVAGGHAAEGGGAPAVLTLLPTPWSSRV